MIIDGHRHIDGPCEPILREMDALGIAGTVLVGVGVTDLDVVTVRDSMVFRFDCLVRTIGTWRARRIVNSRRLREALLPDPVNDRVREALANHPDRFAGFVFVNPESTRACDELERCLDDGLRGIKLALLQYPTDLTGPNMAAICAIARARHVPVFIHQGLTRAASDVRSLVREFADVDFIIAHAGVQYFRQMSALATAAPNVHIDTSSYYVTSAKLRALCRSVGPGKLIFGSDVPVMSTTPKEGLAKIMELPIRDEEKQRILGGNLATILAKADGSVRSWPGKEQ